MMALERLFSPRSIAVLGGRWARNVIEQLDRLGFDGDIHPVHPTQRQLAGRRCLPSLHELPCAPDAVFIGVNADTTIDCVQHLSSMGAGGAVCFASGFSETSEHERQQRLVAAAGDMPILGPNCYGFINYLDGVLLWPDQHGGRPVDRGVAILCQSSNVAINLSMQHRGLPIACLICVGNAAQTGLAGLIDHLLADERISAIGLYIEGIDDARALAASACAAQTRGTGLVAIRSGRSRSGAAAAATHTAALCGENAAASAFLQQAGIAEVPTLEALLEALKILHVHGPLRARHFCAVTCSGGEAALLADLADGRLCMPAPSPIRQQALRELLGARVTPSNPLDYQTDLWGDTDATSAVFQQMLDGYDAGLFVIDLPRSDRCDTHSFEPALQAIECAGKALQKPAFPVASLPENLPEARATELIARGVVPLLGLQAAIDALSALSRQERIQDGWQPHGLDTLDGLQGLAEAEAIHGAEGHTPAGSELLDEALAKRWLSSAGISVPRGLSAQTLPELRQRLVQSDPALIAPLALKGLGLLHKSERQAVRLGLSSLADEAPMDGVSGYLIEEMVQEPLAELLIGLRREPPYGLCLTVGMGGTQAELLADTVTRIAPLTARELALALKQLRLWPLLDGYRGRARADVDSAIETIMTLQQLMMCTPEIIEIEINPLILRSNGVFAVDAIVRRRP